MTFNNTAKYNLTDEESGREWSWVNHKYGKWDEKKEEQSYIKSWDEKTSLSLFFFF